MKTYYLNFSSGNPADATGLTPTLTTFSLDGLTSIAAPGITETPSGSGLYRFYYAPTLTPVVFVADGGSSLDSAVRYRAGTLDPIQSVNESVSNFSDSFGSTSIDPTTVLGYLKRLQEFLEGNQDFIKSTGSWNIYSRGSSTLLREKTLTNNTSEATRE